MRTLTQNEVLAVSGGATALPPRDPVAGFVDVVSGVGKFFSGVFLLLYLFASGKGIGDIY